MSLVLPTTRSISAAACEKSDLVREGSCVCVRTWGAWVAVPCRLWPCLALLVLGVTSWLRGRQEAAFWPGPRSFRASSPQQRLPSPSCPAESVTRCFLSVTTVHSVNSFPWVTRGDLRGALLGLSLRLGFWGVSVKRLRGLGEQAPSVAAEASGPAEPGATRSALWPYTF